ncbi:MFS transporter [Ereboglobus luteus]|nr:MFS transporter [Ereboglobus luteus]
MSKQSAETVTAKPAFARSYQAEGTVMAVLVAMSCSHMLNDIIQSLIPSIYPLLQRTYDLSYWEIGVITMVAQLAGSIFQPIVGLAADRRPMPWSLAAGMLITLSGILTLGFAHSYAMILCGVALSGAGSAIFHPEASRLARLASGGKFGLAQSLFQVGGNFGTALGPVLARAIITPRGEKHILWFTIVALIGFVVLMRAGAWYKQKLAAVRAESAASGNVDAPAAPGPAAPVFRLPMRRVVRAITVLVVLIFSKQIYLASMTSYYTFYMIRKFGVSEGMAQMLLFVFLASVAAGTFIGGPVGDRVGRKIVIWVSILGAAPFTLLLPHAGFAATIALTVVIGLVLASAFSAILVYAQELIPGKVGLVAGLFFGFAFGLGGIGSALLGRLADSVGIEQVYFLCSFLPLLGLVTVLLPDTRRRET